MFSLYRFVNRCSLQFSPKWNLVAMPKRKVGQAEGEGEGHDQQDSGNSEPAPELPPAAKRGRGSPKKAVTAAEASEGGEKLVADVEGGESEGTGTKRSSQDPTSEAPPAKRGRGRPKKSEGGETAEGAAKKQKRKPKKEESTDSGEKASSSKITDWEGIKWDELGQTKDARPWTKKFSSWNVNGLRAWIRNGGLEYIRREDPDIFCLQETKCSAADIPNDQVNIPGYHIYWHSAQQKGYSGVGLYSKVKPLNVTMGLGIDKYDREGRLITVEYDKFYFLTSYVPNAGEGLKRLDFKQAWDTDFRAYLKKLDAEKPVILCGDLNVAHLEIDLANPKTNQGTAGFTKEEREDFSLLLKEGFVDSYRHLYPDKTRVYTYWSYRFNTRAKNIGWRLDYFVMSERLVKDLCDCVPRTGVYGSDHCPLVLSMAMD